MREKYSTLSIIPATSFLYLNVANIHKNISVTYTQIIKDQNSNKFLQNTLRASFQ